MGLCTGLGLLVSACMFIAKFFAIDIPYDYSWFLVFVPLIGGFVIDVLLTIVAAALLSAGASKTHRKFFRDF